MDLTEGEAVSPRRETAEVDLGVRMGEVHVIFVFERERLEKLAVQPDFLAVGGSGIGDREVVPATIVDAGHGEIVASEVGDCISEVIFGLFVTADEPVGGSIGFPKGEDPAFSQRWRGGGGLWDGLVKREERLHVVNSCKTFRFNLQAYWKLDPSGEGKALLVLKDLGWNAEVSTAELGRIRGHS